MRRILCAAALASGIARAADVAVPFDVSAPDVLASGSEIGAGIDPNAGQEITRPSDLTSFKAGLRSAGGVLQNGKGSVILQANPFLLTYGREREYRQMVAAREALVYRWLEDLAVTAVVTAGTPNGADPARFSTFGVGVASELLGTRSPFSPEFDQCVNGQESKEKEQELLDALPPISERDQPGYGARRKSAEDALRSGMQALLESCRSRVRSTHGALYATLGGRWVGPGQARRTGDPAVRIDREYAGFAFDLPPWKGLRVSAQARWLAQRPADDAPLASSLDAALALQWSNDDVSFAGEARRSATESSSARSFASVAVTTRVRLPSRLALGVELQGRGDDLGPAVRHAVVAVTLAYSEGVLVRKTVEAP